MNIFTLYEHTTETLNRVKFPIGHLQENEMLVFGNPATTDGPWSSINDCAHDLMSVDPNLTIESAKVSAHLMFAARRKMTPEQYRAEQLRIQNNGRGWQN